MNNKKFSFLNSTMQPAPVFTNDIIAPTKATVTPILDTEVMGYVIKEFSEPTAEISKALTNLMETLESSINFIEDKSSSLIKETRDFELSGKYRETSIKLHEISSSIGSYLQWIEKNSSVASSISFDTFLNSSDQTLPQIETALTVDDVKKKEIVKPSNHKNLFVYEDFSGLNPISFSIGSHNMQVDNWDDLLVKTAAILNERYRKQKNSSIFYTNNIKVTKKKSPQNNFRDTVIEMLIDYKVPLKEFTISSI